MWIDGDDFGKPKYVIGSENKYLFVKMVSFSLTEFFLGPLAIWGKGLKRAWLLLMGHETPSKICQNVSWSAFF